MRYVFFTLKLFSLLMSQEQVKDDRPGLDGIKIIAVVVQVNQKIQFKFSVKFNFQTEQLCVHQCPVLFISGRRVCTGHSFMCVAFSHLCGQF